MESLGSESAVDGLTFDELSLIAAIKNKGLEDDATLAMLGEWQAALDSDLDAQGRSHDRCIQGEIRKARLYAAAGLSDLATGTLDDAWDYLTNAVDLDPTLKVELQAKIQSCVK